MSKKIFELAGIIAVDGMSMAIAGLKDLDSQFKAAEKSFFKFGRQLSSAGSKLTTSLTLPIAGLAVAAYKGVEAASNLGETVSKVGQLFGESGEEIRTWSESTAQSMGQSKQAAMDAAATFGIYGKSAGLAGRDLVKFSTDFTALASDLASFHNTKPEEAVLAIGSALRGEALPLRRFGILLDDASMRTEALRIGIIKTTKDALTPQQKVLAAQALIYRQSADAQGDFARTSGGLANQQRILTAEIQNVIVDLGQSFLPMALDLAKILREDIIPLVKGWIDAFNGLSDGTKRMIVGALAFTAAVGPALLITGKMIGAIAGVSAAIGTLKLAFSGFALFLATNPLGATIVAVGLLTAGITALIAAFNRAKKLKEEKAKGSYIADEEADLKENIRLWRERIDWLKAQKNPSIAMREELADMQDALKRDSEELAKLTGGQAAPTPVTPIDEDAIKAAKRKREEIARVNADYDKRLFDATIHSDQERYERERDLALIAVKNMGGDVGLAYEAMEAEHTAKLRDAENERLRVKREASEAAANREKEWTQRLVAQSGDKLAIIESEKQEAIAAAQSKESEIAKIEAFYREEKRKAEKEMAKEASDSMMDRVNSYMSMIGNIGSGIASLFQQSTANKQASLDNQQQAERQAIESSTMSEKEKRKAIEALDKKQDAQQRAFRRKSAAESKKINIFESIMGTASAVINALGSAMPPLNFIYAGIVGAIGAAKTALIAAQPLPLAKGALVQGGRGGILAQVGEASQDELVLPVESGVKMLARRLRDTMRDFVPAPLTLAGAGSYGGGGGGGVAYHIGTFIGDDRGIKEFERRQLSIRNSEAQRKGQMA